MAKHVVDYSYDIPEWGTELLDIDLDLDIAEKEELALVELKEMYPEFKNLSIDGVKELLDV